MGFRAAYSDPLYKQISFYVCRHEAGSYGLYYDTYSNGTADFDVVHNDVATKKQKAAPASFSASLGYFALR